MNIYNIKMKTDGWEYHKWVVLFLFVWISVVYFWYDYSLLFGTYYSFFCECFFLLFYIFAMWYSPIISDGMSDRSAQYKVSDRARFFVEEYNEWCYIYKIKIMRKIVLLIGLILMASTSLVAQKFPKVILSGDYPDPSIMRDGKDYYMTHSPFYYMPGSWYGIHRIWWIGSLFAG